MKTATIESLVSIDLWEHDDGNGTLVVIPDSGTAGLRIPIHRVFVVTGVPASGVRGDHAHRDCTQVVVCPHGRVTIKIDDGRDSITVVLDKPGRGLSIPPGLWNHLTFKGPETVIMVFCDMPYDPADYIRDRQEYARFKGI